MSYSFFFLIYFFVSFTSSFTLPLDALSSLLVSWMILAWAQTNCPRYLRARMKSLPFAALFPASVKCRPRAIGIVVLERGRRLKCRERWMCGVCRWCCGEDYLSVLYIIIINYFITVSVSLLFVFLFDAKRGTNFLFNREVL